MSAVGDIITAADLSLVAADNPYWDAVRADVQDSGMPWRPGPTIGGLGNYEPVIRRDALVGRYAWSVTDPSTVAFVAEHLGPRAIDPIAGSGYWAHVLSQCGIDVIASDIAPPDVAKNGYHKPGVTHFPVTMADAADAVTAHAQDRTLFLSWPTYDDPTGARILAAYQGERFVYIGESGGGCCGGDDMWQAIREDWHEVATHRVVQWYGLNDWVTVYERGAEA